MYMSLHKLREFITSIPIRKTENMRWAICERNRNIGWNDLRLQLLMNMNEVEKSGMFKEMFSYKDMDKIIKITPNKPEDK